MRIRSQKKVDPAIPTGSMADIAFLLIIFFMVTTVHEVDRTSVNVPTSMITDEAEKGAAIVVLYIDPVSGEQVYKFSDGKEMSKVVSGPGDIYLEASRIMYPWQSNLKAAPEFLLKADAELPFEKIDELLVELRRADVQRVRLLSKPRQE